jgi:hypothetical protein
MNEPIVSTRAWRVTLVALIATLTIPILMATWIATQGSPAAQNELWRGFDDRWAINSGSIVGDQWQVQLITNSIGLALHPIDLAAFTFQARITTRDPNAATGLIINAQDRSNFIAFLISGDGYISLREKRSGQWIDREPWRAWPHVRRDDQANVLRVECEPNRCIFFVNDEVTLQENASRSNNGVGLIAYPIGLKDQPATVVFDQISAVRLFDP